MGGRKRGRARAAAQHHGWLIIDKPAGPTSHDVVQFVRWALRCPQVGHCGTLDPLATGVLVLAVGAATRLVDDSSAADKRYLTTFSLGTETSTLDAAGEITRQQRPVPDIQARAEQTVRAWSGQTLLLPPPAWSAVRVDGVRAHQAAREGRELALEARPMQVLAAETAQGKPTPAGRWHKRAPRR